VIRICDRGGTEIADLQRVQEVFDELLGIHRNIGMLLVLTHETPLPGVHLQRYAKDTMLGYSDRVVVSIAVLGLGFWASAMRSALGLFRRIGSRSNMWLESSVEQAIARLTHDLIGIDADALTAVYQQLWEELVAARDKLAGPG
jgi:hypothetical protein